MATPRSNSHRYNSRAEPLAQPSLDAVLAEAVTRLEAGRPVDFQKIKTDFPEAAAEIDSFLSFGTDLMALMGSELGPPAETAAPDASTAERDGEFLPTEAMGSDAATAGIDTDRIPTNIGRFEVLEELGEGSFGRVFVAYDELINRKVAIKQAKQGVLDSAAARRAYLHEARAVAQLDHPAIVKVKDVRDVADEPLALILQYVEGPTLADVMRENDHPREEIVEWIAQIADALDYAHQRKVVHRDMKPANIVVTTEGGVCRPVLLDFGLAMIDEAPFQASGVHFAGTAIYTSPEQASNTADWATAQSDIFSLGAILYHVLTGELPFRGRSRIEVLNKVRSFTPPAPKSIDGTISNALDRICGRALEKRPQDRYANAADMARDLRAALLPKRPAPRRAWIGVAAAIGLVTGIAALAAFQRDLPVAETRPREDAVVEAPPANPPRAAQDVGISLELQPDGRVGSESVLRWEAGVDVEAGDRFKLTAETAENGPLYAFWFKPDGSCVPLNGGADLRVLECPGVDAGSEWTPFDEPGAHLLLAISTGKKLSKADAQLIVTAGKSVPARLKAGRSSARAYYPNQGDRPTETTRGAPIQVTRWVPPSVTFPLLGELGETLRSNALNARYQALFLRVLPDEGDPG